jgi:hypothetical protein
MNIRSKVIASTVAILLVSAATATESAAATYRSVFARTTLRANSGLLVETVPSHANPNAGNPPGARAPTESWKDPKANPNAGNPPGARAPTESWKDPKDNPNAGNPPGARAPTESWKDPKDNPNAGNPPGARAPTQAFASGRLRQASSEF